MNNIVTEVRIINETLFSKKLNWFKRLLNRIQNKPIVKLYCYTCILTLADYNYLTVRDIILDDNSNLWEIIVCNRYYNEITVCSIKPLKELLPITEIVLISSKYHG